jgi:membrane fusion protein (multidrug efflux system)
VRVRASVPNEDDALRAGMFVEVKVVLPRRETVLAVPATAVLHAPYGDSVFVVETKPSEKIAHQTFVRTGEARGDFIVITNGLKAGDEVVAAGAFKLRNGSKVDVTTNHAPAPELAPKPPNR